MDIEKLSESFKSRVESWYKSQEGQQNAIAYEQSFISMMDELSQEVLREVVEDPTLSVRKKSGGDSLRADTGSQ